MLRIRLRRMGSKQDPYYRVVVSDGRTPPTGRFVEILGIYDPRQDTSGLKLDVERTEEWIRKGAHPSDTVKRILLRAKADTAAPAATA